MRRREFITVIRGPGLFPVCAASWPGPCTSTAEGERRLLVRTIAGREIRLISASLPRTLPLLRSVSRGPTTQRDRLGSVLAVYLYHRRPFSERAAA